MNDERRFNAEKVGDYDLIMAALPNYDVLQRAIVEHANITPAKKHRNEIPSYVIDLGCGNGHTTKALLETPVRKYVFAVDSEPDMIRQFSELLMKDTRVKKSEEAYYVADVEGKRSFIHTIEDDALAYLKQNPQKHVDAVVSGYVLHNLQKPLRKSIIDEVHRVLKTNGVFSLGDKFGFRNTKKHDAIFAERITRYKPIADAGHPDVAEYWTNHDIRDNELDLRFTYDEAIGLFKSAGFVDIRVQEIDGLDGIVSGRK